MTKFIIAAKKHSKLLLSCLAIMIASPSHAEYYLALDATYMDTKTIYRDGTTPFELTPLRLKFGRHYKEFGWEFQLLSPADDTGTFTGAPIVDKYELNGGLGLLMTVASINRRFYGGIGFTVMDSDYTELTTNRTTGTTAAFTTINLGTQFEIAKQSRITLDYTFYHGNIDCNFCSGTGNNPDVRMSTYAIGYSYSFE